MEVGVASFNVSCHVFCGEIEKHHDKHRSGSVG